MIQYKQNKKTLKILFAILFITIIILSLYKYSFAQNTSKTLVQDIKSKIDQKNENIKQLEQEIQGYQSQIESLGKEADSLKKTLSELTLSKKKLEADLAITENKISATNLEIKELTSQIGDKQNRITDSRRVISQSLSNISVMSPKSILENILGAKDFTDTWSNIDRLSYLQSEVKDRIHELQSIKTSLEQNKKKTETKKVELVKLEQELKSQKQIIADTVNEQNNILKATKNTEANYKKIVSAKQSQKEAFERELAEYESALKIAIDPSKIPHTGTGVLSAPLQKLKITQYFGNTPFATKNPQVYNGKGHTGVDFAASIGTPVYSALSGTVIGVANTDLAPRCYSYGKWIMVKHSNGLSTLYAHLSLQSVKVGDEVDTGQLLGYSGNTGYSTGPHLHFGVYASQGVKVTYLPGSANCKNVLMPLADPKAYLNPLSFL